MVALVLLPGLDGTGLLFADFAAALAPEVKVIVASYPPDAPLGYAALEPVARSFLPRDEPFFLLGESFSGPIAIAIAAEPPPGLLGLILCCSFARNPLPLPALLRRAIGLVPVSALPIVVLGYFLLGRSSSPALRGALARALAPVAPSVLRARGRAALSVDVSALLSRISVPVLYLRASEDRVVPRSASELIVSRVPHAEVAELRAPHFLLQASPAPAAAAVGKFMADPGRVSR